MLSKLIEIIIYARLKEHVMDNKLLPENQSGFRPTHNCVTALLEVTDGILSASDGNDLTILVVLDYSKAFDRINYRMLLAVLRHMGFTQYSLTLMDLYLIDGLQRVKLREYLSECRNIVSGVPQGSILLPPLFTLYTVSFKDSLSYCKSHFYADDT